MREIKFRAWLPNEETMLFSENNIDDDFMEIWDFEGVEIQVEKFREGGGEIYTTVGYERPEAQIIMQYTGLKDRNGKEIYEGDIVRTDFRGDGTHESIQVIEFYEGSFGSRNDKDHFRIPALFSGRAIEGMNTNYFEVIGNIHQNGELLKGNT